MQVWSWGHMRDGWWWGPEPDLLRHVHAAHRPYGGTELSQLLQQRHTLLRREQQRSEQAVRERRIEGPVSNEVGQLEWLTRTRDEVGEG